jgi:tRNA threonylcarbamoyladenosine biosynthesis protein TsaB
MYILSIDTSTKTLSLAVSQGAEVLRSRNIKLARPLSSSIMPGIKKILADTKVPLDQIGGFAVGLGPGSFTSLRVGLSTVKAMAYALSKPVVGIPSLDILASNVQGTCPQVCVLCDARRNLVYACVYDKSETELKRKSEYLLVDIGEVLKKIKGEVIFTGDGVELYKNEIKSAKGIVPRFTDKKNVSPQARDLALLAWPRFKEGQNDHVDTLVPLYLYPDHCQIKKQDGAGK